MTTLCHHRRRPGGRVLLLLLQLALVDTGVGQSAVSERACAVTVSRSGAVRRACLDITRACVTLGCGPDRVCALSPDGTPSCLPATVRRGQHCGSEQQRLAQPCPPGAAVLGFGRGCTFCSPPAPVQPPAAPQERSIGVARPPPPPPPPGSRPLPGSAGGLGRVCLPRQPGGRQAPVCVHISAQCRRQSCPEDTVCGLTPEEEIECFHVPPESIQNCGSEELRLSHPCPAPTHIMAFVPGCTICVGADLLDPTPASQERDENQQQTHTQRACVSRGILFGEEAVGECYDISTECEEKACPEGTKCGLSAPGQIECFADSERWLENCGSEELRLMQPCPQDTSIRGFGQGCTFCEGSIPFRAPAEPPQSTGELEAESQNACIVRPRPEYPRSECIDISIPCQLRNCPQDTVCGLDLSEQIQCFPESVRNFEICGSDEFRTSQPCPHGSGILGFGQGCTFCEGSRPEQASTAPTEQTSTEPQTTSSEFTSTEPLPTASEPTSTELPTSTTELPVTQTPTTRSTEAAAGLACINRKVSSGVYRRGCRDISSYCRALGCGPGLTCALDPLERPACFRAEQLPLQHCGSAAERLAQPCPDGAVLVAYGAGCTFCRPDRPTPPPTPTPPVLRRRACLAVGRRRQCVDISDVCRRLRCGAGTVCALSPALKPLCLRPEPQQARHCGSEHARLAQPCPAGTEPQAFAAGCTFCRRRSAPTPRTTATPPAAKLRACYAFGLTRECIGIERRCLSPRCQPGHICVMNLAGKVLCMPQRRRGRHCGSEMARLRRPCPGAMLPQAFGAGCTYCRSAATGTTWRPACLAVGRRRACVDISEACRQLQCRPGTVCALDLNSLPRCVPPPPPAMRNCGSDEARLRRPCAAGATPAWFAAGCTFCQPQLAPVAAGAGACVARRRGHPAGSSECQDLRPRCAQLGCSRATICALNAAERLVCFSPQQLANPFCGTRRQRLAAPCGANRHLRVVAYGQKCNYCR